MAVGVGRRIRRGVVLVLVAVGGCDLDEVTLVDPTDVVVAEVILQVAQDPGDESRLTAFVHRTVGAGGTSEPVPGARIIVSKTSGASVELAERDISYCVATLPELADGSCYWTTPMVAAGFRPGDGIELYIELPGGAVMRGATTVPGAFALHGVPPGGACTLPADTSFDLRWDVAAGAWAYVNEAAIRGLPDAMALRGIQVTEDPLHLLGVSISEADTSIIFPGEFGVFNRFELERDLATALQSGLPPLTEADVSIAAADRNWVNWVRGGNFNPSGQVRLPSITGAGTGVFGAVVLRRLGIAVEVDPAHPWASSPPCPSTP
ncbi:MAG: hypothetical protein OEZ65_07790 [Gemmatimonadota bacterium]|nr:hypothetical protein [Gemmatimonadota bacterium]MDH5759477.1 hypothetical protein [Gemmatimonadota bacterium]